MTAHQIPARIMANVLTVSNLLLVIVVKDLEGMTAVLKVNLLIDTLSNDHLNSNNLIQIAKTIIFFSKGHLEGSIEITSKTGQSVKFTGKFAENLLWKLFTCFGGSFEKMNSTSQSGLTDAQRDKVWPIVDAIINGALKNSTTCSASLIESRVAMPMQISQDSARSLDGLPGIDGRIKHITPEVTPEKQVLPRALIGIGIEGKETRIRESRDVNESSDKNDHNINDLEFT